MSVVPSELANEVWTRWQGHVIDGVFPLGRFLGCSDHSGVFLTRSAARGPSEAAIKLIATNRALAEAQLPRWQEAGSLAHPHLLGLAQWGECELDGLPYLYVVMEYADQTLAQLLQHRALTDDEVREMLGPMLDVLAFLHSHDLVHGQLKPANILVVGDRLKLASDTIRRVSEGTDSTAGDIWALGVTLLEALTRRAPSDVSEPGERVTLPVDFPPMFRDVVARCLRPDPKDRPSVTQLLNSTVGPSASMPAPEPRPPKAAPPRPPLPPTATALETARRASSMPQSSKRRVSPTAVLGALVMLAVAWSGIHLLRSHFTSLPTPGAAPVAEEVRAPVPAELPKTPGPSDVASSSALHEVIPEVSHSAHRTIRGHIKIWVRVVVDQDGKVDTATLDRTVSSRYFRRLALEAAKKWTFPPINTPSRRLMEIRFDFSRDGTTGQAVTLDESGDGPPHVQRPVAEALQSSQALK